jgi:Tfp pilus assembly protein PilX
MNYSSHTFVHHRGYVLVLTLVFLGIFFTISGAYLSSVTSSARITRYDTASAQALALAEAGIDKSVYQLNQSPSYTGETNTALGSGTFTTTVTSINSSSKRISVTASVPNNTHPLATKTIKTTVSISNASISFRYGVQAGVGGFSLTGGSSIQGSVYANGDINATNGVHITGSATAVTLIGGGKDSGGVFVGTTASDNAWAHTIQGATVTGILYCQSGSHNNKSCNTTLTDPAPQPMPLSDSTIQEWKDNAAAGGTIVGNYHVNYAGATLGPKKIVGNLLVDGGGMFTVSGTLWVTGTITVTGGGKVQLASSYGANNGAIVSDSTVSIDGGGTFSGSGTAGSYPFLITTSTCPAGSGCNGKNAISISGGAGTVAIVAQNGTTSIDGGSSLKAVTAKQITMTGGATLTYDSGLINANFSSGPGGSWEFVPGSYSLTQ